jgi:hypothetical protein
MPTDFEREKDAIVTRFLFDNTAFGYWRNTYIDRLFLSHSNLYDLLSKEYFMSRSHNKWQDISQKYGFDYTKLKDYITKGFEFMGFYRL